MSPGPAAGQKIQKAAQGKITVIPDFKLYREDAGPRIYANSGTWINEKDCTFVKTEGDGRTQTVGVWAFRDNRSRPLPDSSGTVEV